MAKMVRYNGNTQSWNSCSDPSVLNTSTIYEVVYEDVQAWQTNYILRGVLGKFNSIWFEEVEELNTAPHTTYIACSNEIPVEGKRLHCNRLISENGIPHIYTVNTSPVRKVTKLGDGNVYGAETENSIYIVSVG